MGEVRKIICPACHTVLTVGYFNGIEAKSFTCPKCRQVHKYSDCRPYVQEEDQTDLRHVVHQKERLEAASGKTFTDDECTQFNDSRDSLIGNLKIHGSDTIIQLKKGRNIIGRKASSSKADIQLSDESNTMSREHFYIDVLIQGGKVIHILSVCPTAKNSTLLNDTVVGKADKLILHEGYNIKAGRNIVLDFIIPK